MDRQDCNRGDFRARTLRYTDAQPTSAMKDLISPGANCVAGAGRHWLGSERDTDPIPKQLEQFEFYRNKLKTITWKVLNAIIRTNSRKTKVVCPNISKFIDGKVKNHIIGIQVYNTPG